MKVLPSIAHFRFAWGCKPVVSAWVSKILGWANFSGVLDLRLVNLRINEFALFLEGKTDLSEGRCPPLWRSQFLNSQEQR